MNLAVGDRVRARRDLLRVDELPDGLVGEILSILPDGNAKVYIGGRVRIASLSSLEKVGDP